MNMKIENIIIEQHYAKEALRIMTDYDLLLANMQVLESEIEESKGVLINYKNDLENLRTKSQPEKFKEQELREIMIDYEKKINKIQDKLKPYLEMLGDLNRSSHTLYALLKEKYPNLEDSLIKEALFKSISKLNN